MNLVREIALKTLSRLKEHDLSFVRDLSIGGPLQIDSVTYEGSGLYTIHLDPSSNLNELFSGAIFYISGGINASIGVVSDVDAVSDSLIAENLKLQDKPGGKISFYEVNLDMLESYVEIAKIQCEQLTELSFSEIKTVTEYRDAIGTNKLILQRKKWRTITEIRALSPSPYPGLTAQVSISDLDIDLATNFGILQIVHANLTASSMYLPRFPKGKIAITGTYGYLESEVPQEIKRAIEYMSCAIILGEELSRNGVPNSFGIDSFTIASDVGRDIEQYNSLAKSLLARYISLVPGS